MTITYRDEAAFYDGISALVQRGMTFKASHHDLSVTLLGGF